ncbi:unnamed protein product [Oppiella nova]|uniref:HEAT repeat-containing protein 1 n=1 Tax=Oppiella nova TaxID=334625 RepID=A0A7R9MUA2_9ACAR|nr:unnamed protein product [Oppiella nova]CAG2183762.1 unnamed protein product [Oppiella nova]
MIPKRILLSSVDSCFNEVSKISIESLCELMALLKQTFEDISSKGDVQNIQKFVKNLLLKTLDVRNMNRNSAESTQIDSLENSCNETFCALIPKMTEITFRPLFYKLNP